MKITDAKAGHRYRCGHPDTWIHTWRLDRQVVSLYVSVLTPDEPIRMVRYVRVETGEHGRCTTESFARWAKADVTEEVQWQQK